MRGGPGVRVCEGVPPGRRITGRAWRWGSSATRCHGEGCFPRGCRECGRELSPGSRSGAESHSSLPPHPREEAHGSGGAVKPERWLMGGTADLLLLLGHHSASPLPPWPHRAIGATLCRHSPGKGNVRVWGECQPDLGHAASLLWPLPFLENRVRG